MRHTLDFDDICYYVDVVDEFVSKYMQDTFMKDELLELPNDEPFEVDKPNDLVEEVYYHELVVVGEPLIPAQPKKTKISHAKKWWRRVTTKKEKPPISPTISNH